MKLHLLHALAMRLKHFRRILKARRIEENVIEIVFSDEKRHNKSSLPNTQHTSAPQHAMTHTKHANNVYHFDMTRSRSFVYKADLSRPLQDFTAPFDMLLYQLLNQATLLDVRLINNDRILRLDVMPKSSYKDRTISLQLEFTGKNTNAILIDHNEVVIEALRHISATQSFRTVKPGAPLTPLPPKHTPRPSQNTHHLTQDIDTLLSQAFKAHQSQRLKTLKKQKIARIQKKIDTLNAQIATLPDEATLMYEAQKLRKQATIILSNLHTIKPYDTHLQTYDFEGNPVQITLPPNVPINRISEHFFNAAKKLERKQKHIHIERTNLQSKRTFYENTLYAIMCAKTPGEVEMLAPKRARAKRKKEKQRIGELFWIEGYKVMVGRNAKENQALLEQARANDVWMHVRNIPGSHVIIRTDKQNLPQTLLQAAAKLCVDFSVKRPGDYEVDYTKRKFVKLIDGSNVIYDKHKTLHVLKEGIEIRI